MRIAILLFALAAADTGPSFTPCKCARRDVGASGSKVDWDGYTKAIRWHQSLEEARTMARERGRLVFHLQVVGDLDKEGC